MRLNIFFTIVLFLFSASCQTSSSTAENTVAPSANSTTPKKKYERPKPVLGKEALLNIPYRSLDTSKSISSFAFASCNDQNLSQPLWKMIKNKNPQLMLMMGDNVYVPETDSKALIDQYIKLNQNKDYLELREAIPFLATWDDHDFGKNDSGGDNPDKLESKRVFLNYWSYLKNILPKDRKGIYHSRIVGDKKRRVQFIMLDTRFDRSPLVKIEQPLATTPASSSDETAPPPAPLKFYQPSTDVKAHILSEEQWHWLENELQKPAELRILVSSIQFIADDHGFEKWGLFPFEKKKFLSLIEKNKIKNLVILSGDRHLASIAKMPLKKFDLFDITSSSLNKPARNPAPEVDQLYTEPSYMKINYGLATIDWAKKHVEFQIIGEDDKPHLTQMIHF